MPHIEREFALVVAPHKEPSAAVRVLLGMLADRNPCGSGLARDGGVTFNTFVD
jgi:hypothetical protein